MRFLILLARTLGALALLRLGSVIAFVAWLASIGR